MWEKGFNLFKQIPDDRNITFAIVNCNNCGELLYEGRIAGKWYRHEYCNKCLIEYPELDVEALHAVQDKWGDFGGVNIDV